MKNDKIIWAAIIIIIVVLGIFAWKSGFFTGEQKTISAEGTAEKIVSPDQAVVYVGYISKAGDAQSAQAENAETINAIIDALKQHGLTDNDIETSYFYVNPDYDWQSGTNDITGYTATHSLKITLSDIESAGEILDAAVQAGANDIGNVMFELKKSTEESIKQELFAVAAQDARIKADGVAQGLGVKIKGVQSATISSFYYPPIYRAVAESASGSIDYAKTAIESGEITVSVSVTVSFLI